MRRCRLMFCVGGLALSSAATAAWAGPQVGSDASAATVLIRVTGDVEGDVPADLLPIGARRIRESNVEIGTGSGFLITPFGHILTCAHVVSDSADTVVVGDHKVDVKLIVRRIDVSVPSGGPSDAGRLAPRSYEATVVASDPQLDLAVLSVSGSTLPYVHLGDSDTLEPGDAVTAIGYPFGRSVEIGRSVAPRELSAVPDASVSPGHVSAFRADDSGRRRYLQTTAAASAGSSGGPVLDEDGYVAGIVSRMLVERSGGSAAVPFAVAVNVAKEFLEARGLDALLDVRRLYAGSPAVLSGKGMRVAFPYGLEDRSAYPTRVNAGGGATGISLQIDRVLSPWTPLRLADALTRGRAFEPFAASTAPVQRTRKAGGRNGLAGHVTGTLEGGATVRMEYAIVDLGTEKLVARYIGPPDQVAFNASVLRASLEAIEGEPLRSDARDARVPRGWVPLGAGSDPLARVEMPEGWFMVRAGPMSCQGLPAAAAGVSASPPGDFALALRVGWLGRTSLGTAEAAKACGDAGTGPPGSYQRHAEWLGTSFVLAGRFVARASGELLQFESVAPAGDAAILRELLDQWIARLGGLSP